jgi:hypothetical protein
MDQSVRSILKFVIDVLRDINLIKLPYFYNDPLRLMVSINSFLS